MAVIAETVSLTAETVDRVRGELRALGLDGWLLFNFRGNNPVAGGMMGLPAMTRRWFVYLPAEGTPVALTHRIEQQPWETWIGEKRQYSTWRELERELGDLLRGKKVAMEYAAGNAVPYIDIVPAGVLELVRAAGAEVVSSGDLVSAFYSRWTPEGEASHRRAAQVVHDVAHDAFRRVAQAVKDGGRVTEWEVRGWIQDDFARRGLRVGADCIVAVNANAANAHYGPTAEKHAEIRAGDLLLIDLWGKEDDDAVYADQTWMGYLGDTVPDRLAQIFGVLTAARDAAIELVLKRSAAGEPVRGYEVDAAAAAVIERGGYGEHIIHRTGHSIDRDLHGMGPNIDNQESRDLRTLIRGVGFSIEPGIYIAGDVGFRTEIDMYMGEHGGEVTTPNPQRAIYPLFREDPFA
ncbi:MAG TPA: M24 family metallopeptidase [Longimicrobium sp.]|nr:M24 family metallopeptidase [Longimicrobium sp.]